MSSSDVKTDAHGLLGFIKSPDGSFTRVPDFIPVIPAAEVSDPTDPNPVFAKDIPINQHNNTWARIYLPRPPESNAAAKLPLIVFFHGGGFIVASAASDFFQKFCCSIVRQIPAVMVSVEYRNAPEHRLPAAYDDCLEALHWLKTTADEWLTKHADFSKCFIMGNSAGGNIVYHIGLHVVACLDQLTPLKIQGLILHQPFFGGVERTGSEIRLVDDKVVPQHMIDFIWDLALPVGVDRDHKFCNPMTDVKPELMKKMRDEGWRILVTGYEGDPLVDRQIEVAKMLKENGVDVVENFGHGACHGIEFFDHSYALIFCDVLKNFLPSF